ncbi:MAG: hypothetical protein JWM54_2074, partial [Acidobacteriaceae bacterium]|nr:hypothetical protein [Acidobacteriaceae bacterium]
MKMHDDTRLPEMPEPGQEVPPPPPDDTPLQIPPEIIREDMREAQLDADHAQETSRP